MIDLPASITISPGGDALLTAVARASATAAAGDDYGFIVLRKGDVTRRIPYAFLVERPGARVGRPREEAPATSRSATPGRARAVRQRVPLAGCAVRAAGELHRPADRRDGRRAAVRDELAQPAVNMGVSVILQSPNSLIDPFFLGSRGRERRHRLHRHPGQRERLPVPLPAPTCRPRASSIRVQGQYFVAVDSGRERVHRRTRSAGRVPAPLVGQRRQPAARERW